MPSPPRPSLARYGVGVAAFALAALARLAMDPWLGDQYPLVTFFVALVFASWYGGFGPSLLTLALSCSVIPLFAPPLGGLVPRGLEHQIGLAMYLIAGLAMAAMGGSMGAARGRAEAAADRAREESLRLEREAAERARAEGEVRRLLAEQRRLTAVALEQSVTLAQVFDQAPVGIALFDADLRYARVNAYAAGLSGHEPGDLLGRPYEEAVSPAIGPDAARETAAQLRRTLETGEPFRAEGWSSEVLRGPGRAYHADWDVRRVDRPGGGVFGLLLTVVEVTEHVERGRALAESEARFRQLADTMPQIVWVAGPDHSLRYINRRWTEYTGLGPEESYIPGGWRPPVHPDDVEALLRASARASATGEPFEAEYRIRARDGSYRWHLGRSVEVRGGSGEVVARFGTATDIDDRRRAEQSARFVAGAGAALAALVDEPSALQTLADLAVPAFADWCAVDLAVEGGAPRRLAVAHADPAKVEFAHELHRRYPTSPETPGGVAQVIRTGRPALVPEITPAMLEAGARDPEHLRILRELGLRSYLCVPLAGRAGTLGALSFVAAESGRTFGEADLRLAEDLSRRAAVAIENSRLYGELKEADRRKDVFLATLAHELRNPLAPIRNALRLMSRPEAEDAPHEAERAMAERQVAHLARLVEDLMDLSRINHGKIELRRREVDLAPAVGRAVDSARPAALARGHSLEVDLPDRPVRLLADPTRLEQVLGNLLNNAVKYTEPGGRIRVSAGREGGEAVVRVADSGIGIAPEVLPRVFEMFEQAEGRHERSQGGLGIGLSLARDLVRLHGGTVEARSEGAGRGSEFILRLPALAEAGPEAARPAPPAAPARPARPPRRRVLVVDDNEDAANSLARLLARFHGQDVEVVHDGPAALEAAGRRPPELILMDIGMPGMDGYEVARRLRARPEFGRTTIVALTGWGQEGDRARSREAGFDRHLVKPVDPDALLGLLAEEPAATG